MASIAAAESQVPRSDTPDGPSHVRHVRERVGVKQQQIRGDNSRRIICRSLNHFVANFFASSRMTRCCHLLPVS